MELTWNDRLTIDNGVIDDDHRIAIFIVNQFIDMKHHEPTRQRALEVIDVLRRHMHHHFEREEAFQRSVNFVDSIEHARAHRLVIRRLDMIADKLEHASADEVRELVLATTEVIRDWLLKHILDHDMKMKPKDDVATIEADEREICFV